MGSYGIKIAKSGYDYDDGDNRLIYNSSYPLLKQMTHGTGTITLSSGSANKTIYTHNLGYKAMAYVYINYIDINTGTEVEKLRMCSWRDYAGLGVWSKYHAYSTTTAILLAVSSGYSGSETLDYIYVVYYDPVT